MSQVKIWFELGDDGWAGHSTESLWASISEIENGFIIDNYPIFVKNLCFGDSVHALEIAEGIYEYQKTLKKSDNSLYRLVYEKTHRSVSEEKIERLLELGCLYESMDLDSIINGVRLN